MATPENIACKVCGARADHFFTADFHKNAKMHYGLYCIDAKSAGRNVDYYRCVSCGFLFTPFFDDWTQEMFEQRVYNKDYPRLDGDYAGQRSASMANTLLLGLIKPTARTYLDYGSGHGICSLLLKKHGVVVADEYDPFTWPKMPDKRYDVVTCQEVMEHVSSPRQAVQDLLKLREEDGIILATTNLVPDDIEKQKSDWWYCCPRVSHISFYTKKALQKLYDGLNIVFIGHGMHMVYDKYPEWAEQLFPPGTMDRLPK